MKTNDRLVKFCTTAASSKLLTEEVREKAHRQIEAYKVACSISRMPNKDRAEVWRRKANGREFELRRLYHSLSGKDYPDGE